jgi:hypothetical protein
MRNRIGPIAPLAAAAGALGMCCGLPVLMSLGVLGAIAGLSLQNWALIGVATVLAAVGWVRWEKRQRHRGPSCDVRSPRARQDGVPHQTCDDNTEDNRR